MKVKQSTFKHNPFCEVCVGFECNMVEDDSFRCWINFIRKRDLFSARDRRQDEWLQAVGASLGCLFDARCTWVLFGTEMRICVHGSVPFVCVSMCVNVCSVCVCACVRVRVCSCLRASVSVGL